MTVVSLWNRFTGYPVPHYTAFTAPLTACLLYLCGTGNTANTLRRPTRRRTLRATWLWGKERRAALVRGPLPHTFSCRAYAWAESGGELQTMALRTASLPLHLVSK